MSRSVTVAICFLGLWFNARCQNVTDEYFITSGNTSFSNITCNRLKNCYIRCLHPGSCSNATIRCDSPICDVTCTAKACVNTVIVIDQNSAAQPKYAQLNCTRYHSCYKLNFTATGSGLPLTVSTDLKQDSDAALAGATLYIKDYSLVHLLSTDAENSDICGEHHECLGNKYTIDSVDDVRILEAKVVSFRPQEFHIIDSLRINITCMGTSSCYRNRINVTHRTNYNSSMRVGCSGDSACRNMIVAVTPGDKLNMFCVEGEWNICFGATLFVSPFFDHTHLMCNGAAGSGSCSEIEVIVPHNPAHLFLHHIFVNEDVNDNLPYAGSLDGVRIVCSQQELCTEWTPFPLLYNAVPDAIEEDETHKSLFFYGNYSYNYLFKNISCSSGEECFIDCKKSDVLKAVDTSNRCASSFVQCEEGSRCFIDCEHRFQCSNMVIKAYGEVQLRCGSVSACNEAMIWLQETNQRMNITAVGIEALTDLTFLCGNGTKGRFVRNNSNPDSYYCENPDCCPSISYVPHPSVGDKKKMKTGVIVLIIVCIVLVIAGVAGAVYWKHKHEKTQEPYVQMEDPLMAN